MQTPISRSFHIRLYVVLLPAAAISIQLINLQKSSTWIATVTIKRVTEADAGQYLCIAQNEYGREVAAINLKVEEHQISNRSTTGIQLNLNFKLLSTRFL